MTGDTRPPLLTQATVNGSTLVLTYDEALDGASTPAAGAFGVTADGSAITVNGVRVAGSTVTLTLATAVEAGQAVTIDYTAGDEPDPGHDGGRRGAAARTDRNQQHWWHDGRDAADALWSDGEQQHADG